MRHSSEFRRAWSDASGVAMDVGKKLLGYLANQKRLSGVDSLVQRVVLEDGTVVEARWDMNIPTVRIYPGGSEDAACEVYVESGMLDLGPNIASDAGERFNRGPPEFDDSPATLYFGDGVDCQPNDAGLNGRVRVIGYGMQSDCLPSNGSSVQSRLTDPVKKQAQALLPASCWSGLMQRYVQAVYGGATLPYSATVNALTIQTTTLAVADTIGLIDFNGTLGFLSIDDTAMTLRSVVPVNDCVNAVLGIWRTLPTASDIERARRGKVLTIALSGCVIGDVMATGTIAASGNRHFTNRSAWVFSSDAPKAVAVFENDGTATAYEATFTLDGNTVGAELSEIASGKVLNNGQWTLLVADQSPFDSPVAHASGFAESDNPLQVGDSYEFPVFATYQAGVANVVSCTIVASTLAIADMSLCFDRENPFGPVIVGGDDSRKCRTDIDAAVQVAYGFHADGWSTVSLNTCFLDTLDDATVVRSRLAGFQGISIDPAMSHDSFTSPSSISNRVPYKALSGPRSASGLNSCVMNNETLGTTTGVTDNYPDSVPCVTTYSYDAGPFLSTEMTRPYFPAAGIVFNGFANGAGLQVLSLAWGAHNCLVMDQYAFNGGRGAYLSFSGAAYLLFLSGDRVHDYAKSSSSVTKKTFTYAIPGDCGSEAVLTSSEPFVVEEIKTLPPSEGDLVLGMWGFAGPQWTAGRLRIDYNVPSDTPEEASATAYPDPRCRGIEKMACSVFMGDVASGHSETCDVSVMIPDSEFEHPGGLTAFIANDKVRGDCDAFEYLGLQELSDAHLVGDLADGVAKPFVLESLASTEWLVDGFAYQSARSLLGASLAPTAMRERGASLSMDRQTITGGYPKVSTPSFVGWA